jgi:tetraacyldisaccharide 4'-kinase
MHVFPGGLLRESLSALGRASCFIITGCKEEDSPGIEKFAHYLQKRWEQTPLFLSHFQPRCYIDCTGKTYPLQHITFPVAAFCGIASPLRFRKSLELLSVDIAFFQGFRDHKKYCKKTMAELERQARMCGAEALLTTEKDLVKLSGLDISLPLYALAMKVDIDPAFDSLICNSLCCCTIQ